MTAIAPRSRGKKGKKYAFQGKVTRLEMRYLSLENDNGKFCILPWLHAHVLPNGDVLPCCAVAVGSLSLGNVRQSPLSEIWNGAGFRDMRRRMCQGQAVGACQVCYAAEKSGGTSLRTKSNQDFAHHLGLAQRTAADGTVPDFHLRYYDVRFSNLCNLRCRMCCPELSSSIASDQAAADGRARPKPLDVYEDRETFLRDFLPHVPYLEEAYFAGGEPLMIDAHYWALEELIKQGRTDLRLRYTTNFSVLGKGSWWAPDLWRHFKHVEIGASLDAHAERGEYIREGLNWKKVLEHREVVRRESPHADFRMAITVGAMNLLHVPDFIRWALDTGFTHTHGFFTNNLLFPEYYSAQVLPRALKDKAQKMYDELLAELKQRGVPDWIRMNLQSITGHMSAADRTDLLAEMKKQNQAYDARYRKSFASVFPELTQELA